MIENIDTSDRTEQRKFGLVLAAAFAIIGTLRWGFHGFGMDDLPRNFYILAVLFFVPGLLFPPVLKPVFILWIKFAIVLNWIMTRVFLSLAFYFMITPTRVMISLFGDDPLKRKWLPETETYWEAPEDQPKELDRYRQMF